ncbi:hypothetical protein B0T21DRAFT_351395 [Apiosordaria backusii]|uniref:Uncharacterized protein n=1 Tax=Apiosordaria backusii TaxID=314023 RepID=A0AA40DYR9_9PEZI|nr:hypothetical protein B0T21DRAFT_351395 [Apiosordaria backusii]
MLWAKSSRLRYIGGDENGSAAVPNVRRDAKQGALTTVQIRYTNCDKNLRYGTVTVNGQQHRLAFQGTAGDVKASVLHVQLRKRGDNDIIIAGPGNGGWGPDVEGVVVPLLWIGLLKGGRIHSIYRKEGRRRS